MKYKTPKERTVKYSQYNKEYYQNHKEQRNEYHKDWSIKNKNKLIINNQIRHFRNNYNITLEQRNKMIIDRNNRCDICGNFFKNSLDTHIDHDHNTGKIRGLLCFNCNHALGKFKDNITILINAINYLRGN